MFDSLDSIYKVWLIFDPRKAMIGIFAFLIVLALLIHMILLSTEDFNWLASVEPAAVVQPVAPGQTL